MHGNWLLAPLTTQVTPIWEQGGGVLGWTCGNMAASALDVAMFYRDLLVEVALTLTPNP